jgi:hypothetical protein
MANKLIDHFTKKELNFITESLHMLIHTDYGKDFAKIYFDKLI